MIFLRAVKFFFVFFVSYSASIVALQCDVAAPIALLMDVKTGRVLFNKNGDRLCYPASTTKMATALYAVYKYQGALEDEFEVSSDALMTIPSSIRRYSGKHPSYRLEPGSMHVGLKSGERLSFQTLIFATMLASGNDAANALAESVSGSIEKFVQEMNVFLQKIGCKNTHFMNPHGLSDSRHITTAYDLAVIARHVKMHPWLKQVVATVKYEKPATHKQISASLTQTNGLLKPGRYYYPYATGVKTGYTEQAGFTLAASAEKGDRSLIAVVCHCDEVAKRYRSAMQLFDAAFREEKITRKLLLHDQEHFSHVICGAKRPIRAQMEKDLSVTYYPSEEETWSPKIVWHSLLSLPIQKGQEVGSLQIVTDLGVVVDETMLLSLDFVEPSLRYRLYSMGKTIICTANQWKQQIVLGFGVMMLLSAARVLLYRKRLKS